MIAESANDTRAIPVVACYGMMIDSHPLVNEHISGVIAINDH